MSSNWIFSLVTFCAGCAAGCGTTLPTVNDVQAVFGPAGIAFDERTFMIDLKGDGHRERVVLLENKERGLKTPKDISDLTNKIGVIVDGFIVFDGPHGNIPAIHQYNGYDGYELRLDHVDGQYVFVSDGDSDDIQHVWGWWHYSEAWPPAGWEARQRDWDNVTQAYGQWRQSGLTEVIVGK
jgi:hypothetical protein